MTIRYTHQANPIAARAGYARARYEGLKQAIERVTGRKMSATDVVKELREKVERSQFDCTMGYLRNQKAFGIPILTRYLDCKCNIEKFIIKTAHEEIKRIIKLEQRVHEKIERIAKKSMSASDVLEEIIKEAKKPQYDETKKLLKNQEISNFGILERYAECDCNIEKFIFQTAYQEHLRLESEAEKNRWMSNDVMDTRIQQAPRPLPLQTVNALQRPITGYRNRV